MSTNRMKSTLTHNAQRKVNITQDYDHNNDLVLEDEIHEQQKNIFFLVLVVGMRVQCSNIFAASKQEVHDNMSAFITILGEH